jgi:parvulin-like peptidyl-prolyl isomerase
MKRYVLAIIVIGLFFTSCIFRPSRSVKETRVLARVDSKIVTAGELDSLAREQGVVITDTTDIELLKMALLDSLIDLKLIEIRQDSIAMALEDDRDFVEKRKNEVANTVFRLMFDHEVSAKIKLDSVQIDSFYKENPDRFMLPEQVKASHILVKMPIPDTVGISSEEKRQKIIQGDEEETYQRAAAILAKVKVGEDWDSLVVKYSQDNSNNQKGGDLGYFGRGRMVAEFDSAVFDADIGEIIGPLKTKFGFHIIRVEDHKQEAVQELDDNLRNNIKGILFRDKEKERADKFVDSLKALAKYTFNDEALSQPDSLLDSGLWVMVVNDIDTVFEKRVQELLPKYLRYKKLTEATPEAKREMLMEIAVTYLLRAAGKNLGYYDNPEAKKVFDDFTFGQAKLEVGRIMRDLEYQPTEEEIGKYFDEHFEELYREKRPLQVQHIIFEDSSLAVVIRDSIVAGADFKEMALRYYPGEPEIREVAYDLGFISDQDMGPEFFGHVNTLEVGEVSMPIKTRWGYHIAKLVNRRADKKLNQVKPGIRRNLIEAADARVRRHLMDQWRTSAEVHIDHKWLEKYRFPELVQTVDITPEG